jgi:uncharacterized membrane protein YuzA (DUF378 family)
MTTIIMIGVGLAAFLAFVVLLSKYEDRREQRDARA